MLTCKNIREACRWTFVQRKQIVGVSYICCPINYNTLTANCLPTAAWFNSQTWRSCDVLHKVKWHLVKNAAKFKLRIIIIIIIFSIIITIIMIIMNIIIIIIIITIIIMIVDCGLWIPLRASNAEGTSIKWRHHGICGWTVVEYKPHTM